MKENKWWDVNVGSALRVLGENPVDGLPPARHTETIAKLARLGPAKNDELATYFGRVINVLLDEVYEDAKKTLSSVY